MPWFADLLESNHQPESRMQENCLFGSEGGAKLSFVPTPILLLDKWTAANAPDRHPSIASGIVAPASG